MDYYWICIRTDTSAGLYKVAPNKTVSYKDFEYIKSECNMEYAEVVHFEFRNIRYMMLVDEEGKLNGKNWNTIADVLYSNPFDEIVGDVAILGEPQSADMCYMTEVEAYNIFGWLKNEVKRYSIETDVPL